MNFRLAGGVNDGAESCRLNWLSTLGPHRFDLSKSAKLSDNFATLWIFSLLEVRSWRWPRPLHCFARYGTGWWRDLHGEGNLKRSVLGYTSSGGSLISRSRK